MKYHHPNSHLDQFGDEILRARAEQGSDAEVQLSPYFMSRLKARIEARQDLPQAVSFDLDGALRWLVACGVLASVLFLGGVFSYRSLSPTPGAGSATIVAGAENAVLEKGLEDPLIAAESK